MNPHKFAPGFFIIIVGVISAYFVIINSFTSEQKDGQARVVQTQNKPLVENPLQLINNFNFVKDGEESDFFQKSANNQEIEFGSANLTEISAKALFGGLKLLDANGNNPFNADLTNPKIQEAIKKSISDASLINFYSSLKENDIKISADNSKASKIAYLKSIEEITAKRFNDKKFIRTGEQIIADINSDCFSTGSSLNGELAELYKNLTDDYLALAAPSDWIDFHKSAAEHFKEASVIYQSVFKCAEDPIKGYAASQIIPQLFESAADVQDQFVQKYKEVGLL